MNVYSRYGGYSFLCKSRKDNTKQEVIDKCKEKHLFDEQRDAKDAYVDDSPTTEDICRYRVTYDI